jgi:ergothioneine biosynthesis protein EgtB
MSLLPDIGARDLDADTLHRRYERIRGRTLALAEPLAPEDMVVQSMPDVSPTKWHLAHVTWFFERFVLKSHLPGYRELEPRYDYLFNSYYYTAGQMHTRARRGLLSRPTVAEVLAYRRHVDEAMSRLLAGANADVRFLVTLGLHHEQQHQELMLTDIKHVLAQNPLRPAYRDDAASPGPEAAGSLGWQRFPGGVAEIGAAGDGFCYDNETPRHRVWLEDFELATRPVTNAEFLEFIADGGYERPELWLSDGWATVLAEGWDRPLYWDEDRAGVFTLGGPRPVDPEAPASHLSYYEADAYARWAAARLPTEAEWEVASRTTLGEDPARPAGDVHFVESGALQPRSGPPRGGLRQMFGDVWEWTASPYAPYPGFKPLAGSLGEYNGKFMCSQLVLKGGSCATPADHIRDSYRNFFYPRDRWQFTGLRLARSV